MKSFFTLFSLLFAAAVHAISATGGERLLVLLDDVEEKEQYSTFLGDLESRGFKISYETPKSESLKLFHLGERTFDHVLLFPSKIKSLGPNLTPNILVQFVNAEGNILLTTSSASTIPSTVANLLAEFDISLPLERTGLVVDHFNYDTISAAEKHDVLVLPAPAAVRPDVKSYFRPETEPINEVIAFPSGVGHTLGASALLTPILRAPKTAYSYNPKEQGDVIDADELYAAGEQLSLVSSFQARNSARFTVVGSADLLSNKWFDAKVQVKGGDKAKTWNREFAKRVAGWTFHEIGVLRVNGIQHYLKESPKDLNPSIYRINSTVSYSVSLSEYSWDSWGPFFVPEDDELQVEFSMLSAYHHILAPNISLHLFPSTHPHLPVVSGRVAYTAALWTSPIAWNRIPVIGNVRLEVHTARMTRQPIPGAAPLRPGGRDEQLVVRWSTCAAPGREGEGPRALEVGKGEKKEQHFSGLFIFQFDQKGRILSHTIETVQGGGDWERGVGAKVVGLTDWLLGGLGRGEPCPAFQATSPERDDGGRRGRD
ncbi:Dolichyl-diphosphooligosaccharide--protein glycosyltransferase like [Verticillium longisporum]|nr:Dolichyl-diphosphooligosaccharide--protein glycosyltransferase like [Verticillium longisporum]